MLLFLALFAFVDVLVSQVHDINTDPLTQEELNAKIAKLECIVNTLGNQVMQNQLFVEERVRSDGMSGVKKVRLYHEGTSPYFADTHIAQSAIAIHDHANYDRTLGIGEFIGVLNGVEFRTRHNDYKLKQPSTVTKNYHETEDIFLPNVPPEVLHQYTIQDQITEMREWYRAFKEQNITHRDYRPYFKPIICALEGAWTLSKDLEESFPSDRHHLDAKTWADMAEKISYTSYTGSKHNLENFAFLPSKLYSMEGGVPEYAQWNYRVICHPLSFDIPTSFFKLEDDIGHRLATEMDLKRAMNSRAARFKINEFNQERQTIYTLLDRIMYELPGLDNYLANITDTTYGLTAMDVNQTGKALNAGFYHRWYQYSEAGAMGDSVNHRGFNDETLWVAMTTQPNIMPLSMNYCPQETCVRETKRVTFAIPLEIIYATPLLMWNPYNVAFYPEDPKTDPRAQGVTANGRNGGFTRETAYNGTNRENYYRTPASFYTSFDVEQDNADTAKGSVGVLDKNGNVQQMAASGPRIITPEIEGVGTIRLRYPIFPVHTDGSTIGRDLAALKEIVVRMYKYQHLLEQGQTVTQPVDADVGFTLGETYQNPPGLHAHEFTVSAADHALLLSGKNITVVTSLALGHTHELKIDYDSSRGFYFYLSCDGMDNCWDGHPHRLIKEF
ncbi:hypothetical protein Bpfe_014012 [Biomphalaria pfeifferi]|uniref:Uncharacterized protein n=1 Tax=Biomphalaria pfeifferi TaxID=112525 RepID=A0AAD8BL22_BIOPF|nr:hypothetical protein Bpfe_014012 [Biomphalaria pfeifferi]